MLDIVCSYIVWSSCDQLKMFSKNICYYLSAWMRNICKSPHGLSFTNWLNTVNKTNLFINLIIITYIFLENPECPYSDDCLEEFTPTELSTSEDIKTWLTQISSRDSSLFNDLQDTHTEDNSVTSFNELLHSEVKEILGDVDDIGKLHGDVEIFYENGDYLWAETNRHK